MFGARSRRRRKCNLIARLSRGPNEVANAIQSHWMFYFPPTSSPGRHTQFPASPRDLQSCKIHFSHTETCRLKAHGRVLGQEGGGEETNRTFRSPSSMCVCKFPQSQTSCRVLTSLFLRSFKQPRFYKQYTWGESQARHKSEDVIFSRIKHRTDCEGRTEYETSTNHRLTTGVWNKKTGSALGFFNLIMIFAYIMCIFNLHSDISKLILAQYII